MSDIAARYWVYAGTFSIIQWLVQEPSAAFASTASLCLVVPLFWWMNGKLEDYNAKSD